MGVRRGKFRSVDDWVVSQLAFCVYKTAEFGEGGVSFSFCFNFHAVSAPSLVDPIRQLCGDFGDSSHIVERGEV